MATAHPRENGFIANGQRYMDVFALHNTTETVNIGDSNRLQVSRRESDKVSVHIATKNVPYPITNFPSLPGPSGYDTFREQTGHGRKRYLVKENELSSDSNTESVPLKKQRLSNTRLGRKKREVLQAKRKISGNCVRGDLVQLNEDDKDSLIIDLIKRLLRIDQDLDCIQYNLFVDHVLTMTKTKANISESVLLSIMYFDYENVQQIKGRHSHVTYILDTKDIMLHFDGTEWELLNLYGEKARGNIENRLKTQNGKKFVSSKYLFIKYNGNAFIEEPEDSTLESDTESPLSTFKPAQYRTGMDSADSTDENTFLTKQHFHRIVKVASSNTDKEKVAETNEAKKCLSIMQLEKVRTATRNGNVKMRIDSTEIASRRKSI